MKKEITKLVFVLNGRKAKRVAVSIYYIS